MQNAHRNRGCDPVYYYFTFPSLVTEPDMSNVKSRVWTDPVNTKQLYVMMMEERNNKHFSLIRRSDSAMVRLSPEPEELVESCHQIMGGQLLYIKGCQWMMMEMAWLINFNYLRVEWSWQCQHRGCWHCCVSVRTNLQTGSLAETGLNSRSFLTSNSASPGKC